MIMAVMMPRQSWTDERLDHFEKRVDERFDRVDERFGTFEKQVDERFKRVDERFDRVDEQFRLVDKRLDVMDADRRELKQAMNQLNRTMSIGFIGLAGLIASAVVFF
jgi:thymidylate kinase